MFFCIYGFSGEQFVVHCGREFSDNVDGDEAAEYRDACVAEPDTGQGQPALGEGTT